MTRRARVLGAPSRIAVALLIAALAFAAAMMADGGYGDNPVFAQTTIDYDNDDDGLIDVRSLAQLNAIRHDLNGNGDATHADYVAAFPSRDTTSGGRMGCPSGSCSGYELRAHLDFDTDGDGSTYTGTGASASSDSGDDYHNGGNGFEPIGSDSSSARYESTFKGNGYTIANLFIKRTSTNDAGLFGALSSSARVESVGLKNAFVHANQYVGSLVGRNRGTIAASWADGAVRGTRYVGGLAGYTLNGTISASYSHASAHVSRTFGGAVLGGLTGRAHSSSGGTARVIASYSTGRLTAGTNPDVNEAVFGLTSTLGSSTIIFHSYWDTTASGIARGAGAGHATATLQAPTGYTGIYANWNVNLVGSADGDDPWDFGTSSEYPVLKFGGMSPRLQRGDYDSDDDGLIEITTLDQLNAVRHDLDGNGDPASGAGATAYDDAFLFRITAAGTRMGCPSGTCAGYELAADLDFDTDGDGSTYSGTGAAATGDTGDDYNNSGAGWDPLGGLGATFKGNGHIISNLFIKRASTDDVGLFSSIGGSGRVESLGLRNAFVHGQRWVGAVAGVNNGTIAASWSGGAVLGDRTVGGLIGANNGAGRVIACYSHASAHAESPSQSSGASLGGLVGYNIGTASVIASYATGAATSTSGAFYLGGLVGENDSGTITNSYYDTNTSVSAGPGSGQSTAALQTVLGYAGVYANWNVNVDGVAGNDDPWDFGQAGEYPALKYGGMDPAKQREGNVDYDRDGDRLIEITTLAQLNVIRHDTNGDGTVSAGAPTTAYNAAFPNRSDALEGNLGCVGGTCAGYELAADLDFDTDGDGATYSGTGASATGDTDDDYNSGGNGFEPIGTFTSTFKGNGHVISNLFIRRVTTNSVGLFGTTSGSARIESVGLKDAFVDARNWTGALVGTNYGTVAASWSSGAVRGRLSVGGLVGLSSDTVSGQTGVITASYSRASVHAKLTSGNANVSGLVGSVNSASSSTLVSASYSTGAPSAAGTATAIAGLTNVSGSAAVAASYWDTTSSGRASGGGGAGQNTAALQSPTGYTGIYANWNVNVDGTAGVDDPWDFGQEGAYPTLKFGGMDPADQRFGDYDLDGDGLIEISSLAQLDAVRHDLDGNGDATHADYVAAFPDRITTSGARMGCPSGTCAGYELIADLDFDTDGDGATYTGSGASAAGDPGDAYYNGGSGWAQIGADTSGNRFTSTFKGNGHLISNLFIRRTGADDVGLFGAISGRVESVGLKNAYVYADNYVGGLVGTSRGTVVASWSGGAIRGTRYVGGLVGYTLNGSITASYSRASAHASRTSGGALVGGLTGRTDSSSVTASYSTGAISAGTTSDVAGLTNLLSASNVDNSYWDTTTSDISAATGGGGAGHDTATLQAPTGYTGIYAAWNVDVDGVTGGDDPWDFGGAGAYPRLKYGGMDPDDQKFGDYDLDGDGLIEIDTLAQLDAVRHDLDGDGSVAAGSPLAAYNAAFAERIADAATLMGCPSGTCAGYELLADLDFDTDGDGATYTGTGADAASDSGDAYHNGGAGWLPIGRDAPSARFNTTFKGNGYAISNLFIKRTGTGDVGLFGALNGPARVESVGLYDAFVHANEYVGSLVGTNYGTVAASWSGGAVRGARFVGGLVGYNVAGAAADVGRITASYSTASAHASAASGQAQVGGLAGITQGANGFTAYVVASYSAGPVTAGVSANVAGLTNTTGTTSITDSHWDLTTSGRADDADTASPEGVATAGLQTVLSYTGVYENWNVDVDGATGADDPWSFGGAGEYPALKFGGMDPAKQHVGDYDRDGDGLIEISTLAQLDVIRHDLNGNGDATDAPYVAAFPDRNAPPEGRMGCRGGSCSGYELVSDLDFDTDGDGATYTGSGNTAVGDPNDAFYNGGAGWAPIGDDSILTAQFHTTFKGNGHVIRNLFIKRPTTNDVGLFGALYATARVESVGVENAYVYGNNYAGILLGTNYGTVAASWTSGAIRVKDQYVGGLVGYNWASLGNPVRPADVIACYSTASVHSEKTSGDAFAAGLVGRTAAPSGNTSDVIASYSTGAVTAATTGRVSGLSNITSGYNIANSYWDSTTTGASGGGGSGQTTTALQTPTGYTGIFANWDVNVDGVTGNDDPWHFGFSSSYPTLKYGGMDPYTQHGGGDYDTDNDGLIEIWNLDRLNAVRWDLDGDALQDTTSDADWKRHAAAFPNAIASLGCPDTDADADSDPGPCEGYELAGDLDFNDADRDGAVDPVLAYPNWTPIGSAAAPFASEFDGNNRKIANLKITAPGASASIGLFGSSTGTVKRTGVSDAQISVTGGDANTHIGALLGEQSGDALGNWSTGTVTQTGGVGGDVGGLIGYSSAGRIGASWSGANVTTDASNAKAGGLGGRIGGEAIVAVYTTGAVEASGPNSYAGGVLGEMEPLTDGFTSAYVTGPVTKTGTCGGASPLYGLASGLPANAVAGLYWNTETTGYPARPAIQQRGYDGSDLQEPTDASTIYADWAVDVDGDGAVDTPLWDFGDNMQYPKLTWDGMVATDQTIDPTPRDPYTAPPCAW